MGSEKQQEEEEERWLVGCLPSFSFSATAQEHALHSLKEKGLPYFDGTHRVAMARRLSSLELEGRQKSGGQRERASHA